MSPQSSAQESGDISGQIYVISGASRGIGLAMTKQLLKQGHTVVAGVRRPDQAKALHELRAQFGSEKLYVEELDVRSGRSVTAFSEKIPFSHIDVLINNAGVLIDSEYNLETLPDAVMLNSLDTNAVGPIRLTQTLLPRLRKSKAPRVANITSQMGSITDNSSGGYYAYRMSKAALNMFTKSLSLDEPQMVVLSLHPGWVQTEMGGAGATITAETSAQGLLALIQDSNLAKSGQFMNYQGEELLW